MSLETGDKNIKNSFMNQDDFKRMKEDRCQTAWKKRITTFWVMCSVPGRLGSMMLNALFQVGVIRRHQGGTGE